MMLDRSSTLHGDDWMQTEFTNMHLYWTSSYMCLERLYHSRDSTADSGNNSTIPPSFITGMPILTVDQYCSRSLYIYYISSNLPHEMGHNRMYIILMTGESSTKYLRRDWGKTIGRYLSTCYKPGYTPAAFFYFCRSSQVFK